MATHPQISPVPNQIQQIARWFDAAVPDPSAQNARVQIGVHFEEIFEMAQVLKEVGTTRASCDQLTFAADVLHYFQRQLKSGDLTLDFNKIERVTLLDALCDQIVTAVGIAHMLGMNIEGALQEVADSNDSKFGEDGNPIFNDQRKIMKGPRYKSPDLAPFTTREETANG